MTALGLGRAQPGAERIERPSLLRAVEELEGGALLRQLGGRLQLGGFPAAIAGMENRRHPAHRARAPSRLTGQHHAFAQRGIGGVRQGPLNEELLEKDLTALLGHRNADEGAVREDRRHGGPQLHPRPEESSGVPRAAVKVDQPHAARFGVAERQRYLLHGNGMLALLLPARFEEQTRAGEVSFAVAVEVDDVPVPGGERGAELLPGADDLPVLRPAIAYIRLLLDEPPQARLVLLAASLGEASRLGHHQEYARQTSHADIRRRAVPSQAHRPPFTFREDRFLVRKKHPGQTHQMLVIGNDPQLLPVAGYEFFKVYREPTEKLVKKMVSDLELGALIEESQLLGSKIDAARKESAQKLAEGRVAGGEVNLSARAERQTPGLDISAAKAAYFDAVGGGLSIPIDRDHDPLCLWHPSAISLVTRQFFESES